MHIHIFTLFPEMFKGPFDQSIISRAKTKGLIKISLHNIRDYADDSHNTVDDYPYGGGPGMVMKPEPVFKAVEEVLGIPLPIFPIVLLTPQGKKFHHAEAERLSKEQEIALICGHYQGLDERIRSHLANEELSIGDYVITGGELAAMVVTDAVARLLPGVLGSPETALFDSHAVGLLQHPQYTRPAEFRGLAVPDVLLSGNHQKIAKWREEESLYRTQERRPDLLE